MLELKLEISDIDYESLNGVLVQMLMDQMTKSGAGPIVDRVLTSSAGLAATALNRMSREKKDELLIRYINSNRGEIARMLESMAGSRNIRVSIAGVEAAKK